ncbi:hypothetical protein DSO57_1021786 [Entomophthora muscae]|uniref:Uncharacterized protein n=1 Tax=Entomophthora muscae TaxID=34485 RepID=A0ACC2SFZ5_9FUNG|nr:hypothetical protein DSO57_1021786 [Entomophthora muscae]
MPRNYYLIAVIVYFCSNLIIFFASICESTTQYKLAYPYPPGHTPVVLAKPPRALDLEYFHLHHLDLPPVMKDIPTAPPLPDMPPSQVFRKLGFVYITVLGLADQVVPHTGSWRPLATALNYLVCIAPIVYMAFQAWPASPVGVQPDSSMGRDSSRHLEDLKFCHDHQIRILHGKLFEEGGFEHIPVFVLIRMLVEPFTYKTRCGPHDAEGDFTGPESVGVVYLGELALCAVDPEGSVFPA